MKEDIDATNFDRTVGGRGAGLLAPMTDTDSPEAELSSLQREAHAFVRRLTSGDATEADARDIEQWCARSPAHAAAFTEASKLWDAFGPAALRLRQQGIAELGPAQPSRRLDRRLFLGGALAATAATAAIMMVRPPLDLWPSVFELAADYRTGTGEQRRLAIADGVVLAMNTQTSIAMRSPGRGERIELIAGEAELALSNQTNAFEVVAASARAKADNAKFAVRLSGRNGSVTCLDGEVAVACGDQSVTIVQRQRVSYDDHGLGEIRGIDPDLAAAWLSGLMIFRGEPLAEVVKELNRYRPGRIILVNAELGRNPINGRFRIDRPDDVLAQIRLAFGARLTVLPGGIVLLG